MNRCRVVEETDPVRMGWKVPFGFLIAYSDVPMECSVRIEQSETLSPSVQPFQGARSLLDEAIYAYSDAGAITRGIQGRGP